VALKVNCLTEHSWNFAIFYMMVTLLVMFI
jgi:hypothetical protein